MFLPSGFRVFCFILVLAFLLCKTGLVHSLFLFSNWQTSYEAAVGMNGIGRVVARDTECNNCEPSLDSRVNVNRYLPVCLKTGRFSTWYFNEVYENNTAICHSVEMSINLPVS